MFVPQHHNSVLSLQYVRMNFKHLSFIAILYFQRSKQKKVGDKEYLLRYKQNENVL